jgi:quinol-cytochrome oxidoreductase complex cytochrome b subunit
VDERFPLSSFIKNHLTEYYAPKNFNFWYFFGALALFVFVMQILTGIFLTMHYKPDADAGICLCGIYNAGCLFWMAYPLYAFDRSIFVFCSNLSAYVQRPYVWIISKT